MCRLALKVPMGKKLTPKHNINCLEVEIDPPLNYEIITIGRADLFATPCTSYAGILKVKEE